MPVARQEWQPMSPSRAASLSRLRTILKASKRLSRLPVSFRDRPLEVWKRGSSGPSLALARYSSRACLYYIFSAT